MMSNEGSASMLAAAKAAGANGLVLKPFKSDQLVAAVMKLARESRTSPDTEKCLTVMGICLQWVLILEVRRGTVPAIARRDSPPLIIEGRA